MGREDKFVGFNRYLSEFREHEITMTFEQIEKIIGEKLCDSAYKHKAYWYASKTHALPNCWIDNGYKMTYLNLKEQKVIFTKVDSMVNTQGIINTGSVVRNISFEGKKPTISVDKVLLGINEYYSDLESDENARYLSWEHCYKVFQEAHNKATLTDNDLDYLSLHLAFYLASWGMLRGSSFLLQKDYKVHLNIIEELYKPCYNNLWGIDYIELQKQENLDILMNLIGNLKTIYRVKRKNIKEVGTDISDTLVTKVLLGTLGCVPAYDEYFKKGVVKYNITAQSLGKSSIRGLAEYYEENKTELENIRKSISKARQIEYPQMKILDMAFWQLGFDKKISGVIMDYLNQ